MLAHVTSRTELTKKLKRSKQAKQVNSPSCHDRLHGQFGAGDATHATRHSRFVSVFIVSMCNNAEVDGNALYAYNVSDGLHECGHR